MLARAAPDYHERVDRAEPSPEAHGAMDCSQLNHVPAALWHRRHRGDRSPALLAALLDVKPHEHERNLKGANVPETVLRRCFVASSGRQQDSARDFAGWRQRGARLEAVQRERFTTIDGNLIGCIGPPSSTAPLRCAKRSARCADQDARVSACNCRQGATK